MLDRLTSLQVFVKVAGLGSLTAAAQALAMSQTMATKHMAALEGRLGVKLLHRTTRRLTLTEAGRRYLEAAERVLAEVEEADAAVAADTLEVRGTLRLNAPVSFGIRQIAPLLPQLTQRHPALTIDLGLNDRYVDLIEEGWDLVIRIGELKSSSLIARKLAPCSVALCAAPSYLEDRVDRRCGAGIGRQPDVAT
jgi:DNA-binding transcriptional LysR family regulator